MIGRRQIQKCSWYAMCARRRAARYLSRRFPRRQQKSDLGKKDASQKARRTQDSENTSATLCEFITATTCKLSRRNPRGFCNRFLLQKLPRPDDGIVWKMYCLHPTETERCDQSHSPHFSIVVCSSLCHCGKGADSGGPEIQAIAIHSV